MPRMTCLRTFAVLGAFALPVFLAASTHAGLTIDLRIPTGDPKGLVAVTPGQRVPIDVYAVVTGTSTGVEGLGSLQGAFIGTGNFVTGRIVPAGDLDEATFTITLPAVAPFNGNGSQPGASKYIGPADGVIDLGDTTNRSDLGDLVVFRANSMQVTSGTVIPDGREFRIGRVEFVVEGATGGEPTIINWAFRRGPGGEPVEAAALFRQDGAVVNGTGQIGAGAPIVFAPEPAAFSLMTLAALTLRRPRFPVPARPS